MGSFLSRRLNQPEDSNKKDEPQRPGAAPSPIAPVQQAVPVKEAPKIQVESGPKKRRTSPKVAELRRQLRTKLLATPDEADEWQRGNPDHQKLILDRLKIYVQRA